MEKAEKLSQQDQEKRTVRINKRMADLGLASRREADELIDRGVVFVNGNLAKPGMQIDPETDEIEVRTLKQSYAYYAFNKPIGMVTTCPQEDEYDIVSSVRFPVPVFPLGRLDKYSHGLILMTNDRRITHRLLDPQFDHEKEYIVSIKGLVDKEFLNEMSRGIEIDGVPTKPAQIFKESDHGVRIILTEGKNRQIRRMVEAAGDRVTDLIRVRIEHILLGNLASGDFRPLTKVEVKTLLEKLSLE